MGMLIIIACCTVMTLLISWLKDKYDIRKHFELITEVGFYSKYVDKFTYKGKELKLQLIKENLTPKHFNYSYNTIMSFTLYINEQAIVSTWVMNTLNRTIKIIENEQYDTKELYKILQLYKKEGDKSWWKNYNNEQKQLKQIY
jgi:hypothetical protein